MNRIKILSTRLHSASCKVRRTLFSTRSATTRSSVLPAFPRKSAYVRRSRWVMVAWWQRIVTPRHGPMSRAASLQPWRNEQFRGTLTRPSDTFSRSGGPREGVWLGCKTSGLRYRRPLD